ncbi:U3 small nucleolar RNA-associated protein 18 [Actinomortierella ambigua]|nr:U3 small nucleolar RNA-associated protein 18 [Actinomortierella ambigua]
MPPKKKPATNKAKRQALDNMTPITHLSQSRNPKKFVDPKAHKKSDDVKPKEKSEIELENLIFGDQDDALAKIGRELSSDEELEDDEDDLDQDREDQAGGFVLDLGGTTTAGPGAGDGADLFFMDTGPTPTFHPSDSEDEDDIGRKSVSSDEESEDVKLTEIYGGKPAWVDEDDKNLVVSLKAVNRLKKLRKTEEEDVVSGVDYEQRLRRQFEKIYPVPSWAQPEGKRKRGRGALGHTSDSEYSDEESEEEDNSILSSSKGFLQKSTRLRILPSESISMTRVKNANQMGYSQAVVQSVEFHPNSQMLLTAGFDRTLRLFQIDGKLNQMVQSVFFKDMPIYKALFSPTGSSIVSSGRRKYFYTYDIEAGKVEKSQGIYGRQEKSLEKFTLSPCGKWIAFLGRDGYIVLVSYQTRQWFKNLKMNGNVRAVAWSSDGTHLYSIGVDCEVYQWEVSTGKCLHRFFDDGGFKPTALAVSPDNKFFAVGSKSGIVNVYDQTCLKSTHPKPLRAIGNLTTAINVMRFNHDSQILAIASKGRKDQLKLIHIPSLKVFPNWPTKGTPLSYVTCLTFSPRSGYLAIGNDKGKVLLYRLNHYASA